MKIVVALFFFAALLHALEPVSIRLKWFYQYQFAGYIMAKEKGFYEEAGLDVTLIERDPQKNHILQVIKGDAEYGIADSSILIYRAQQQPVKIVATIFQHNAMVLLAKKSSNIMGPYEMRSKRISFQEGIDEAIFSSLFEYAGIGPRDYVKLPMDFSYERFIHDEIDVIAAYITDQPFWISRRGYALNVINPISYGIDLYGDLLFTTEKEIAEHPDRVERLKQASIRGWNYALEHPEETVQTIQTKYKPSLDLEQLRYEARETRRLIAPDHVEIGYTSQDRFRFIASIYKNEHIDSDALSQAVDEIIYDPGSDAERYWVYIYSALSIAGVMLFVALFLLYHSKRLAALVKIQTQALERSRREALEAAASKSAFLANMSHEIRTPMNAILGFVEQLSKTERDTERKKQLEVVRSSSQMLLDIINDILDFSKIESGKLSIDHHPLSINTLVTTTSQLFEGLIREKEIRFDIELDATLPPCLMMDGVRFKQILFNLLSNAIKFSSRGGSVTLEMRYESGMQRLSGSVRDNGIGIATENLEKIFNAFDQEDSSTTRRFGGTGLGLAISKSVIELMEGRLWVESEQGAGSRFFFELSAEACDASLLALEHEPHQRAAQESQPQGVVLVVEDNATNQMLMEIILDELGVDYEMVNDGIEALSAFENGHFDLILMDENMPNMNGIEATRAIRSWEKQHHLPRTPIVAVTANALSDDRQRFLDAGMDDYLSKPYSQQQIEAILKRYLTP